MNKKEKEYLDKVFRLGCGLCHKLGLGHTDPEIHHLREGVGAGQRNSHFLTIGLCPHHHRHNIDGIHGQRRAFKLAGEDEMSLLAWTLKELA